MLGAAECGCAIEIFYWQFGRKLQVREVELENPGISWRFVDNKADIKSEWVLLFAHCRILR